jgi:hypothetical protein
VYNEIFGQLEAQKTGELSLATEFDETIEFDQTTIVSGPCWACKLSPAKQAPNCYGPQNIAWLTENNIKHCSIACIGKQGLLNLPAGPTDILNLGLQWARKVYAAIAENYANSKCYISGQRRARKPLFSAFDAAWAGVSHDKLSALKNI